MTWQTKKTKTKTKTFREHPQRTIIETCDLWDIWSEWWWDITWSKTTDKDKDHDMTCELCEIVNISYRENLNSWQLRVTMASIRNSCNVIYGFVNDFLGFSIYFGGFMGWVCLVGEGRKCVSSPRVGFPGLEGLEQGAFLPNRNWGSVIHLCLFTTRGVV